MIAGENSVDASTIYFLKKKRLLDTTCIKIHLGDIETHSKRRKKNDRYDK